MALIIQTDFPTTHEIAQAIRPNQHDILVPSILHHVKKIDDLFFVWYTLTLDTVPGLEKGWCPHNPL